MADDDLLFDLREETARADDDFSLLERELEGDGPAAQTRKGAPTAKAAKRPQPRGKASAPKVVEPEPELEPEVDPEEPPEGGGMGRSEGEALWETTQAMIASGGTSAANNIVVVVRVRPFNQREKDLNTNNCIEVHAEDKENNQIWIRDPAAKGPLAEPSCFR